MIGSIICHDNRNTPPSQTQTNATTQKLQALKSIANHLVPTQYIQIILQLHDKQLLTDPELFSALQLYEENGKPIPEQQQKKDAFTDAEIADAILTIHSHKANLSKST